MTPSEWPPSCCIHPGIQLNVILHRPGAHRWDIWNCLWYVMQIEEKELDEGRWGRWAILTRHQWNDQHAANCEPKGQECDRATSSLTQITWLEVNQILRGNNNPGCKWWYIQTQYWMLIMRIWFIMYNYWVYEGCFNVINVNVNRPWTIVTQVSWILLRAAQRHQLIIKLSAAFLGINGYNDNATMS